jgi:YVTN family beta-propeller protein
MWRSFCDWIGADALLQSLKPEAKADRAERLRRSNSPLRESQVGHVAIHATVRLVLFVGLCPVADRLAANPSLGPISQDAYVTTSQKTVSVIDTGTQTLVKTITLKGGTEGVAVTADGLQAYVTNSEANTVSVIDTGTLTLVHTIAVGNDPVGIAVTPDGLHAYVANGRSNTVSVIDTATEMLVNNIAVGSFPFAVAVTPDGLQVYVANLSSNTVSVIDTDTQMLVQTVTVGNDPSGMAVTA